MVSWAEYYCNFYLGAVSVNNMTITANGFDGITTINHADSWKYSWIFYWIAIE